MLVLKAGDEPVLQRLSSARPQTERVRHGAGNEFGCDERRQADESRAIGKAIRDRVCRGDGETRFADATRAGQREDAHLWTAH